MSFTIRKITNNTAVHSKLVVWVQHLNNFIRVYWNETELLKPMVILCIRSYPGVISKTTYSSLASLQFTNPITNQTLIDSTCFHKSSSVRHLELISISGEKRVYLLKSPMMHLLSSFYDEKY